MSHTIARYAVTFGMTGCYMPDSHDGAFEFGTRSELAQFIKSELEVYGMPASLFGEVRITKLWGFIKRNGSSCAHFGLCHKGFTLGFHGLTHDEFLSLQED